MKGGRVTSHVRDVCKGGQIRVAYNKMDRWFEVDMKDNKVVEFVYTGVDNENHKTFPHEILTSFLNVHDLSATYLYNHQNWGQWHEEKEVWIGTVGMVREKYQ